MTVRPSLLKAILPPFSYFDAPVFRYPTLHATVEKYYDEAYQELTEKQEEFSSEHADIAFLQEYFPPIALKIQEAESLSEQMLWSQKFTEVSATVFGRPDVAEAVRLAKVDLKMYENALTEHADVVTREQAMPLISAYTTFISLHEAHATENDAVDSFDEPSLLAHICSYLEQKYHSTYAVLDTAHSDDAVLDVAEIVAIYEKMLERMQQFSSDWLDWKVVLVDTAQMAVSPGSRRIMVGKRMPPLPVRRVKSLFTHEVLVHAQRAVRGLAYDRRLGYGLPGYVIAEEGLGVLMEAAIEGVMPYRAGDRYIDIALALGTEHMPPVNRYRMQKIVETRTLLRKAMESAPASTAQIHDMVGQHVARIYRGTLGNEVVGVFTKDLVYYRGYRLMAEYLGRYQRGDLRRAIDFVLSSKINPVDPHHRTYIHKQKFNIQSS